MIVFIFVFQNLFLIFCIIARGNHSQYFIPITKVEMKAGFGSWFSSVVKGMCVCEYMCICHIITVGKW